MVKLIFSEEVSLLIYLLCFVGAAILIYLSEKSSFSKLKRRLLLISGISLPVLLATIRYGVGADFFSYSSKIEISTTIGILEFYSKFNSMEPSVWILGNISQALFDSGILFFFICSLLTVLFFYFGLKRFGIKPVGLAMLLILLVVFPQTLSGARQGVAMALSFFAFSFMPSGKLKHFIITILIAGLLFHFSALAMLAIYPVYWWIVKKSDTSKQFIKKVIIMTALLPVVLGLGLYLSQFIPVLDKYAAYYTRFLEDFASKIGTHIMLPEIFALIFMIAVYRFMVRKSNLAKFGLIAAILMATVNLIGYILPLVGRFGDYFMPIFLMVFSTFPYYFKSLNYKKLAIIAVIMWGVGFFIGAFYLNGSGSIFPYGVKL